MSRSLSRGFIKGFLSLYRLNAASSSRSSSLRDEIIFDKSFFEEKRVDKRVNMCVFWEERERERERENNKNVLAIFFS